MTQEVAGEIANDLTPEDVAAKTRAQVHRPPLNFLEMGMQIGDILQWKDDPTIFVTITSGRTIKYNEEEVSISALSAQLKGYSTRHIAPGPHWLYKDRVLSEIYDETYPMEE